MSARKVSAFLVLKRRWICLTSTSTSPSSHQLPQLLQRPPQKDRHYPGIKSPPKMSLLGKKFPAPIGTFPFAPQGSSKLRSICTLWLTLCTAAPMAPFFVAGRSPQALVSTSLFVRLRDGGKVDSMGQRPRG